MANNETIKKVFALVFFKFPGRKPEKESDLKLAFDIWSKIFANVSDSALMNAASRFVAETVKLYPDDDPLAMINQMAAPILPETEGDCIQLALDAVAKFGYMGEDKAMAWLKERSPLIAASVKRVGYRDLCLCEQPDVIKGQLRAIFKTEKARSIEVGGIVESAKDLTGGIAQPEKLIGLIENIGKNKMLTDGKQ